jgi:glycerophosphoryl diester phosphodiesterase
MTSRPSPELIAHRGFSVKAPENTLSAMEAALDTGIESVEFDVQTAACGTPVLFHDTMLGRTTNGVGPVQRRPLAHLKALDAGSWFGQEFSGEKIPTLDEALANLRGRVFRVYQDIKGYREIEDLDRIVTITRNRDMAEATVFISSDWVIMNRLRRTAPEIPRAYLVETADSFAGALDRAAIDDHAILDIEIGLALSEPKLVREARGAGVEIAAWTVDESDQATEAMELGITRITTNQVEKLLAWRFGLT